MEYYFTANDTGEVSGSTLWEAHKAYIRGILIEIGARKKRQRTEKTQKLIEEITRAEQEHKKHQGHHQVLYLKVVNKRVELKMVMEQETRKTLNRIARERYQWGNKPSKHLARMVPKKKPLTLLRKYRLRMDAWCIHQKE